jgi:hypothetical protein
MPFALFPRLPGCGRGLMKSRPADGMLVSRTADGYTDTIGAGIGEASRAAGAYRIIVGCERDEDELAPERGGATPEAMPSPTCLEQTVKEALMARTVVRVIEPGGCNVQMFPAQRVIARPGL